MNDTAAAAIETLRAHGFKITPPAAQIAVVRSVPAPAFKVDKAIPLPEPSRGHGFKSKYNFPLSTMSVGDSFAVPLNFCKTKERTQSTVCSYARAYGKKNNSTFATRVQGDMIRVWRTA